MIEAFLRVVVENPILAISFGAFSLCGLAIYVVLVVVKRVL